MGFQARRKRAAKLTNFFGASYRDLFGEVLEKLEIGFLEEARNGNMSGDEIAVRSEIIPLTINGYQPIYRILLDESRHSRDGRPSFDQSRTIVARLTPSCSPAPYDYMPVFAFLGLLCTVVLYYRSR